MVLPQDDKNFDDHAQRDPRPARLRPAAGSPEEIFHDPTTGAANDIEKATAVVGPQDGHEYGMSERVGAVKLGQSQGEVFLGRDYGHQRDYLSRWPGSSTRRSARSSTTPTTRLWAIITENREHP